MKFSLCRIVILDDNTHFNRILIAMRKALNLYYDVLAKRNHNSLIVEYLHRFFYKRVTISAEERGTNDMFVLISIAIGYALNSALIDGADILRSILPICQKLHFSVDINAYTLTKLIQKNGQAVLYYLKLTESSRHVFSFFSYY